MKQYRKIFALPRPLLAEGAPVCILRGALLYDSTRETFVAQLKLKNVSGRKISAVHVSITEKNAAGINYRERIAYTYSGVSVAPEAAFGERCGIPMGHKGVRSFDVMICEVLFADGSKWDGNGAVFSPAPAQTPLRDILPRDAQIAWRARYGKRAVYQCAEVDALWLCTCGTPNTGDSATCSECGACRSLLLAPDLAVLAAEGYTRRVSALIARGNEKAYGEAEALIATAPEGVDGAALTEELEAARLALARKRARRRRAVGITLGISIPAAVLALTIVLLSVLVLVPLGHYNRGVELAEARRYYDAYCAFVEADGFKDAENRIDTVEANVTEEVRRLLNEGEIEAARALVTPFKNVGSDAYNDLTDSERSRLNSGDGSSFLNAISVSVGTYSFSGSTSCYYSFTPSTTGYYSFYSVSPSDVDALFYDANQNFIDGDTSVGNFDISRYLFAGTTYYLKVTPYPTGRYVTASIYISKD